MKPKTSKHDEKYWQDIFDSISMDYLPVEYMNKVIIRFISGTVWEIDIKDSKKKQTIDDIEATLEDLFNEYEPDIESLDFRMDMDTLKHDLSKRVSKFIKLNK